MFIAHDVYGPYRAITVHHGAIMIHLVVLCCETPWSMFQVSVQSDLVALQ
jgi:hypothetical protein